MQGTELYSAAPRIRPSLAYDTAKRVADVAIAATLLVALSPLLLAIAAAIWLDTGLPLIYRCRRVGRHGAPITVVKFRTMRDGSHQHLQDVLSADEERRLEYNVTRKLRHDPRRTRIGGILRRTSLDELPQLVNVVAGDMSLVGPRPYFADEMLPRPEAYRILSIRPGITGLWQVNGRSDRTFEERIAFDLRYVAGHGPGMDAAILVRTVFATISGRGAY